MPDEAALVAIVIVVVVAVVVVDVGWEEGREREKGEWVL